MIGLWVLKQRVEGVDDKIGAARALLAGSGSRTPPAPLAGTVTPPPVAVDQSMVERAIAVGMRLVGTGPYVYGGPCGRVSFDCATGFDCSGFVNYCFHKAGATWNLPQTGLLANKLPRVQNGQQQRGDIMVMAAGGEWSAGESAHTGIWLGDGTLLQCGIARNGVGVWGPVPGWPYVFVRGT